MGIIRFDPFHELNQMRHQIDRYLDNFWGRGGLRQNGSAMEDFGPKMDIYQTDDEVVAAAELPGIESKDDIDIRVDRDRLTIKGEFKRSQDHEQENYLHTERYFGTFTRVMPLPTAVKPDQATAKYINGVLEVHMPKSNPEENKGHRITIQ